MTLLSNSQGPRTSIDRVRQALVDGGFKPGRGTDSFVALCPVHGDKSPSLSVTYDATNERTLVHCFTCEADFREIAAALNLSPADLFDRPLERTERRPSSTTTKPHRSPKSVFKKPRKLPARLLRSDDAVDTSKAKWKRVTTYVYADAQGSVVQEVYREQARVKGETVKRFTQRFVNPATGRMVSRKPKGFEPVLYEHASVVEAVSSGKPVWLLEGEKDVDNATAVGVVATTNAQGASSFPDTLLDVFRGARVNIVADRDLAGYARAVALGTSLAEHDASVRLFLPAVTDDKADLTDHLDSGFGLEDLIEVTMADVTALREEQAGNRAIARLRDALAEADARVERAESSKDDRDAEVAHARTWIAEAESQFLSLAGHATEIDKLSDETSSAMVAGAARHVEQLLSETAETLSTAFERVGERLSPAIEKYRSHVTPLVPIVDVDGIQTDFGHDQSPFENGEVEVDGPRFKVWKGDTVEVKIRRDGDQIKRRYNLVMRGWARIDSITVDDDGQEKASTQATSGMTLDFFRWKRSIDGEVLRDENGNPLVETEKVYWDADQLRDGTWSQALPWPGMLARTTRNGRETAMDAILNARQAPATRETIYKSTGWRETDAGPVYIHGNGAIAKGGTIPLRVELPKPYDKHYKLPEPTEDKTELRNAWNEGLCSLMDLPARVIAPLLGVVWESTFQPVPLVVHLVGGFATAKTSIARQAMHFLAPELCHRSKNSREILSGANQGSSTVGMVRALSAARDIAVLMDDIAPDGDIHKAEKKLSELARLNYNGSSRTLGTRRGGFTSDGEIRAAVITTGEITVTGSSLTRLLSLPLDSSMIQDKAATFAHLEQPHLRGARGLLGASLIQWMAQNYEQLAAERPSEDFTEHKEPTLIDRANEYWLRRVTNLPHPEGVKGRMVEAAVAADHGASLMMRMMVDREALTRSEANEFLRWARDGIYEALSLQEVQSDAGAQLVRYLREALISNAAHLTLPDGSEPEDAETMGWTHRGQAPHDQWFPSGPRIGVVDVDRIYLFPSTVLGVANTIASRSGETFTETTVSVSSALLSRGWVKPDSAGKRSTARRINGQVLRVWDIPLSALLDDEDETPPGGPAPLDFPPDVPETPNSTPVSNDHPEPETPHDSELPAPAGSVPTTSAAATQSGAAKKKDTFTAAVAVLDSDGVWLPNSQKVQLDRPIRHLGDFARVAAQLNLGTMNGWKSEDGQIIVTESAALELGIPFDTLPKFYEFGFSDALKEATKDHSLITLAKDDGFKVGGQATSISSSMRVWHETSQALRVRVMFLPAMQPKFQSTILGDAPTPAQIADRLQAYADALHFPFWMAPSTTGMDLMPTLHWKNREVLFAPSKPVPPAMDQRLEADADWHRALTADEANHEFIHAFDRSGSYLAATAGLELGIGHPEHFIDGRTFDKKLPGYWRVTYFASGDWRFPNPLRSTLTFFPDAEDKTVWVTTPTVEIAQELGYDVEIHEAYVWNEHGRILSTWYERMRDARATLDTDNPNDQIARDLLKQTYVSSLGLMGSHDYRAGRPGYAPERYHHVQAKARANIFRRVNQIGQESGRWPVAILKDTIFYTSNDADPTKAWPGREQHYGKSLGRYKHEGIARLSDVAPLLTGEGPFRGKQLLEELI